MSKRRQPPSSSSTSPGTVSQSASGSVGMSQETVIQKEMLRVANRRRHPTCRGLVGADDGRQHPTKPIEEDLTGLALSGGGIRSACFGMGVVSALQHTGLFRSIDYLSTVSGGGYLGAHISSWYARLHEESPAEQTGKPTEAVFPFPPREASGRQGRSVRQLIYGGDYIVDGLTAFNKYLIGLLFNNLAVISLMVSIAALVAWFWRLFDYPVVRDYLTLFDVAQDFTVPFIPGFLFGSLWIFAWLLSYYRRQGQAPGAFARPLLRLTVGSVLIAVAMLFGNGDLLLPWRGEDSEAVMIPTTVWLPFVVLSAVAVMLIPVIRPGRLIQSAIAPKSALEQWVFRIVTSVMLVGIPLILIGFLGRENISGYFDFQERGMHEADFEFPAFPRVVGDLAYQSTRFPFHIGLAPKGIVRVAGLSQGDIESINRAVIQARESLLQSGAKAYKEGSRQISATVKAELDQLIRNLRELPLSDRAIWGPFLSTDTLTPLPESVRQLRRLSLALICLHDLHAEDWLKLKRRSFRRQRTDNLVFSPQDWEGLTVRLDDYLQQCVSAIEFSCLKINDQAGHFYFTDQLYREARIRFASYFTQQLLTEPALTDWLIAEADAQIVAETAEDRQDEVWADALVAARNTARELRQTSASRQNLGLANWQLLRACFPDAVTPANRVQRRIVIEADQATRLKIFVVFLGIGLISGWVLNINLTSMHRYYRDRLGETFVVRKSCGTSPLLSELNTTAAGAPYHLINACVSRFGWDEKRHAEPMSFGALGDRESDDPRRQDTFVFSHDFVGSHTTGFMSTGDYVKAAAAAGIQLNVDEVVAISGAAVSPARNENVLVAFLMFILNLRLGQWLPNPGLGIPSCRPSFLYMLSMLLKSREKRPYVFLSDGGHAENTGIVELLKRRCRLIIACDAGHDPSHSFADIANAVRLARNLEGVRLVEFTPDATSVAQAEESAEWSLEDLALTTPPQTATPLTPLPRTKQHFKFATILYPRSETGTETPPGLLILVKPSITGDEPVDVLEYQRSSPEFPQEPTTDLVFSPAQVESYRQLGYHIGIQLAGLFQNEGKPRTESSLVDRGAEDNLWATDCAVGGNMLLKLFHDARRRKTSPPAPQHGQTTPRTASPQFHSPAEGSPRTSKK